MMKKIEIRNDGLYVVQDVFEKQLVQKIAYGWHVLFSDTTGNLRFGYVLHVDVANGQVRILDDVLYPIHSPLSQHEIVPFSAVITAGNGFTYLPDDIYTGKRKIGHRTIGIIIKDSVRDVTTGWITRKNGRAYVDCQGERWFIRE